MSNALRSKLSYLTKVLYSGLFSDAYKCPNCGEGRSLLIERKYLVTSLRRCVECSMMFRVPADSSLEGNRRFYNEAYTQGFTTDMPDDKALRAMTETNFVNTEKDYSYYLSVLEMLGYKTGCRLIDFGCSWGYGSYQLVRAGYDVWSYEISRSRGQYAKEKLGVRLIDDLESFLAKPENAGSFDVFFSSHVIEHVPSPGKIIAYAQHLLKPGGVFIAFHPNGSFRSRAVHREWRRWWGEVHPNMIDDVFYDQALAHMPRLYGSSPGSISAEQRDMLKSTSIPITLRLDSLEGAEMFVVARR